MTEQIERLQRVCRTCQKPFSISPAEQLWLKDRELKPFTHCKECRKRRRGRSEHSAHSELHNKDRRLQDGR